MAIAAMRSMVVHWAIVTIGGIMSDAREYIICPTCNSDIRLTAFEALRKQLEDVTLELSSVHLCRDQEDMKMRKERDAAIDERDEARISFAEFRKENAEYNKQLRDEHDELCAERDELKTAYKKKANMYIETLGELHRANHFIRQRFGPPGPHPGMMDLYLERDELRARAEAAEAQNETRWSKVIKEMNGVAVNLAEPSKGDLERINDAYTATREKLAMAVEKLESIVRPTDCGCNPCRNQCHSQEALEIRLGEIKGIARDALEKLK